MTFSIEKYKESQSVLFVKSNIRKMTYSKGMKRFGWWEKFKEEKLEDAKKILGHVGLYVGLIVYTALGGLVRINYPTICLCILRSCRQ